MQVGSSGIMGGATSYLGGNLGSYFAKPISKLTEGIASPILKEVLTQGTLNSATGFGLGTALALGSGADLGEALKQGSQSAALGLMSGIMNGTAKGYQTARQNKISPWNGEPTEGHHSDPKFMGGDPKQDLTPMSKSRHKQLHKDMNDYLKEQKDMNGNHMRPQRGNSGKDIQRNFDRQQRIDALKGFYNKHPLKYWDPKLDFYRNNKMMKQWRPW